MKGVHSSIGQTRLRTSGLTGIACNSLGSGHNCTGMTNYYTYQGYNRLRATACNQENLSFLVVIMLLNI